jgi:hypothetical protein
MKIFIVHYTPLVERKQCIIKQLRDANITDYEFIETYDRDVLRKEDITKFANIKLSEISLFMKNIEIFKQDIDDTVVVLEDDAILIDNFKERLNEYLTILASMDWDIAFTGGCCNIHARSEPGRIFYESNGSRGACMYILNKGVCKKMNTIIKSETQIVKPIDHWFNDMRPKYNLKYYLSEPELVIQGSEIGVFHSAIR